MGCRGSLWDVGVIIECRGLLWDVEVIMERERVIMGCG